MMKKSKITKKDIDKFIEDISPHKDLAKKVVAEDHLDFDTLYEHADGNLKGSALLQAETHLSACEECQTQLTEIKEAIKVAQEYQPVKEDIPVPERVLKAIPKPKKQRGAYAKLIFNANCILEKVQGIARSTGGILESLTDFTVETLAPDTDFLVETRGITPPITDYRTQHQDMEVIFSTLPEQGVIEVYLKIEGKKLEDIRDWDFQIMGEDGKEYRPTKRAIAGDTLKLVFSNVDLNNKSYEFQIPSQPVTD